jgi:alpha-ketoglutarate-dependent taurine dioxygenase
MDVTALDAPLAAMVRGWDPSRAMTHDEVALLRDSLARHHVLVLRGQPQPTAAELARFANQFGPVAPASDMYEGISFEHHEVMAVSNELNEKGYERGVAGSGSLPWHTDYSFLTTAAKESFLEALLLPPGGGPNTMFCDLYAAYDALSDEWRARLLTMTAHHTLTAASGYSQPQGDPDELIARQRQRNPDLVYPDDGTGAWHPAVITHPETGRRALYVSEFVSHFDGLDVEESRSIVRELLAFATTPERVYSHAWQVGDLIVFDTVGTVHRRDNLRTDQRRTMRQLSTLLAA